MTTINIDNLNDYHHYESDEILFSHLQYKDKKYFLVINWGGCRTYLSQALMGKKLNLKLVVSDKQLPLNWSYKTGPMYLPMKFHSTSKHKQNLFNHLAWLNKWEEQAGVVKSRVYETQDPNVVVVEGSKYWKDSCWKMTLWTYLVKCACYTSPKKHDYKYWTNGLDLHSNGIPNIDHLLANVKQHYSKEIFDKRVYGPHLKENTHTLHGFFSICTGWNPPMAKALGIVAEPAQYFKNKGITEW